MTHIHTDTVHVIQTTSELSELCKEILIHFSLRRTFPPQPTLMSVLTMLGLMESSFTISRSSVSTSLRFFKRREIRSDSSYPSNAVYTQTCRFFISFTALSRSLW